MLRDLSSIAVALIALCFGSMRCVAAPLPPEVSDAIAWYDTLGYPDAEKFPYVRASTGFWTKSLDRGYENRFIEGFLIRDEPEAFTVFVCSVSDFASRYEHDPFPPLSVARLVKKSDGPEHLRAAFDVLNLEKKASATLERAHRKAVDGEGGLTWGAPVPHRVRIFAFARACLQKGLFDSGASLMQLAAGIPDDQRERVDPRSFEAILQDQLGELELQKAEERWGNPATKWEEMLPAYESFETRYPGNRRGAYAREAAEVLRKMIAEEKVHDPKPLEQMTPAEQAAEQIYQLRNLPSVWWVMHSRYPVMAPTENDRDTIAPIVRLVDLDRAAIPLLIAALDDRRFTRCMEQSFHMQIPPHVMRVGDIAKRILEHMSGRNLTQRPTGDAPFANETTKKQAEAWWAEQQAKGEKQQLVEAVSSGGQNSPEAARRLAEKYPDAALTAIEAGFRVAARDGTRADFVDIAATLKGDAPLAFLRAKLGPDTRNYPRVQAAEALFARGQPGTVPAMIQAWDAIQPRLHGNRDDAYGEVGRIIAFLFKSGDPAAIVALRRNLRTAPLDARLSIVKACLPKHAGLSSIGAAVHVDVEVREFKGEQAVEIERLLRSQLQDKERRLQMKGSYEELVIENPRVCDVAALALAKRWPAKYKFEWSADAANADAQIAKM